MTELNKECLELLEHISSYFYTEALMLQSEKYKKRLEIMDWCMNLASKLKGESK